MVFEMPVDEIKQLRILLRKEANLSWYQPEKEDNLALPKLPSVTETVAKLDPSPPYIRCKNCNGRLLRGVHSFICVFCGTNPHNKDLPPEPIQFKNTLGYRWLLESLQLDGSEMVAPMEEENASNRGRSESEDEIPLTELLDLEIRWSSEAERTLSSNSDSVAFPGKSSLNLAGVDLDSFFDRKEPDSDVSEQNLASGRDVGAASDNTFQANQHLSLFQNVQASEASAEDQSGDSFSGWEANFKTASSGPAREEPKSVNHSKVELDTVSEYWKDSVGLKKNDDFNPSASSENDYFQGDGWRTSNSEVHSESGKPESTVDLGHTKTAEISTGSSTRNLDWMQDDQWQGSDNKTPDIGATDKADDSFDGWNDFTGSISTQDPSGIISSSKITDQTGKYGFSADLNDTKTAEGANSSSNRDFDWKQDDQWQDNNSKTIDNISTNEAADSFDAWNDFTGSANAQYSYHGVSDSETTGQTEKFELTKDPIETKTADSATGSSSNFDWMQNDQWQGSNNNSTGIVTTNEVTDSFDAWNDFSGSAISQNPSSSVSNSEIIGQTGKSEITADLNDTKTAESATGPSGNFDWMQNDQWQGSNNKATGIVTANEATDSFDEWNDFTGLSISQNPSSSVSHSEITGQTGKSEITADLNDAKTAEGANASPVKSFDWKQDDQWQVSNSKTTDTVNTNDIVDSFDDWNGFTSSTTAQDPFSNVWKQTVNQTPSEKTFEMDLFNSSNNSHDMALGGSSQHDLFSGQFNNPLSSLAATNAQPVAASSNRVADVDTTRGNPTDVSTAEVRSKDDAEMLMSQMHDLSFMLESNLSLPPK